MPVTPRVRSAYSCGPGVDDSCVIAHLPVVRTRVGAQIRLTGMRLTPYFVLGVIAGHDTLEYFTKDRSLRFLLL